MQNAAGGVAVEHPDEHIRHDGVLIAEPVSKGRTADELTFGEGNFDHSLLCGGGDPFEGAD